jgi:hypothetical protein
MIMLFCTGIMAAEQLPINPFFIISYDHLICQGFVVLRIDAELDEELEERAEAVLLPLAPHRPVARLQRAVQEDVEEMLEAARLDEPVDPGLILGGRFYETMTDGICGQINY